MAGPVDEIDRPGHLIFPHLSMKAAGKLRTGNFSSYAR
jgi:hypothetical protein